MRTDILLNTVSHDIVLDSARIENAFAVNAIEDDALPQNFIYLACEPQGVRLEEAVVRMSGVSVAIPYQPTKKTARLRIKDTGTRQYIANKKDGGVWFDIVDGNGERIEACKLIDIEARQEYRLVFDAENERVVAYSNFITDFLTGDADEQNKMMLLQCVPTNNYRYPLTGIGAVRWLNCTKDKLGSLLSVVETQTNMDGMSLIDATYDIREQTLFYNTVNKED